MNSCHFTKPSKYFSFFEKSLLVLLFFDVLPLTLADSEYTSEPDILDSFVYNLAPLFLFTMNFIDDSWNYNSSTGGRVYYDAIFLGTPFILTLILIWIKGGDMIGLRISYTVHLFFTIVFFVTTRVSLNHSRRLYRNIPWKVWIHRILCFLITSQAILTIIILPFMYKNLPEEALTKVSYKYYVWMLFPIFMGILYLIIQLLIFYRPSKSNGNELIRTITRFLIWSILHGILITELWLFPINAYYTKLYLVLYTNSVILIFRYDSPEGIKFGVGFLNFIFIDGSNTFDHDSHLPVEHFFFLDEGKDDAHSNRFMDVRTSYMK